MNTSEHAERNTRNLLLQVRPRSAGRKRDALALRLTARCVLTLALAFSLVSVLIAEDQIAFQQLTAQAYNAYSDYRWTDCEQLFLQASQYGELREGDLRFLSLIRRGYLDRPEDALPVAKYNFEKNPCFLSAMEYCECLADNYDFPEARKLLAYLLGVPGGLSPAESLSAVRRKFSTLPANEQMVFRTMLSRIAIKQFEVVFALPPDTLNARIRNLIKKTGKHPFTLYPDCKTQKIAYDVVDGSAEEKVDWAGNRVLAIVAAPGKVAKLKLTITIIPTAIDIRKTEGKGTISKEFGPYFRDRALWETGAKTEPNGTYARKVSAACASPDRYGYLQRMQNWWIGVKYGETESEKKTGRNFSSEDFLRDRGGCCGDYSSGGIALFSARKQKDMPGRQVFTLGFQQGENPVGLYEKVTLGGHWVAQFYDYGSGEWIAHWPLVDIRPNTLRGKRLTETPQDNAFLVAENPLEPGNICDAYAAFFYGWDPKEPSNMNYTETTLKGLLLEELPAR